MTDSQHIPGVRITTLEPGLAQVIIEPGSDVPALGNTTTVNLHVKDGAVRVSVSEGTGEVRVASGEAIQSGDGDIAFCEKGKRDLAIGDSPVLTAGNGCFVRDGVLHIEVVGDQAAELHMGAKQRDRGEQEPLPEGAQAFAERAGGGTVSPLRCWVCPFM
jgi:hypothetical protein